VCTAHSDRFSWDSLFLVQTSNALPLASVKKIRIAVAFVCLCFCFAGKMLSVTIEQRLVVKFNKELWLTIIYLKKCISMNVYLTHVFLNALNLFKMAEKTLKLIRFRSLFFFKNRRQYRKILQSGSIYG
jgi:hypothetical protein